MSSGERPIGAAKGKQSNTEALFQTSPLSIPATPERPHAPAALRLVPCRCAGVSTMIGVISAVDTLASQAYGMRQYHRVGVIAQRATLIALLLSLPVALLWWHARPVLLALGQPPAVAADAAVFLRVLCPGLCSMIVYEVSKKYLQVQGIVLPVTCVMAAATVFNAAATYALVFPCGLGLAGSAAAVAGSWAFMMALNLLYIRFGRDWCPGHAAVDPRQCWGGWSREAFRRWRGFLEVGLCSAGQICIEWWAIELITFEAGLLGVTALAASTIVVQLQTLLAMVSLGVGISASVVVGQRLGSGQLAEAQRSCRACVALAVMVSAGLSVAVLLLRRVWAFAFTSDPGVTAAVEGLLLITGGNVLFDSLQICLAGVLRGTGLQGRGAAVNFVAQWLVGVPVGYRLAFFGGWGASGLWAGQMCGTVVMAALSARIVRGIDWDAALRAARARAGSLDLTETPVHEEELLLLPKTLGPGASVEHSREHFHDWPHG